MACIMSAAVFTGCGNNHEHRFRWTVLNPATCTEQGLRQGVCGICSYVVDEIIEIDPDNHDYGEWNITPPQADASGSAQKTCSRDANHVLTVALPSLSEESAYTSVSVTTPAGIVTEGVKTYVLANDAGDISFGIPIEPRGIQSVADAVEIGSQSKNQIRSARGQTASGIKTLDTYTPRDFYYEFGNNYTYIKDDADRVETWVENNDGDFFGYRRNWRVSGDNISYDNLITTTDKEYLKGHRFASVYTESPVRYGAEGLLAGLYDFGKQSQNGDFKEELKVTENGYECNFGFGYLSRNARYFSVVSVSFTLTKSYAIKTLYYNSDSYYNDSEGNFAAWERNEDGTCTLLDPEASHYNDTVTVEQTLISELSEEEQNNVPQNPYDKYAFYASSFDLRFNGFPVGEEGITIDADTRQPLMFVQIVNIQPSTANLSLDTVNVYLVTEHEEIPLSATSLTSVGILAYSSGGGINIRSRICGELTLRLKTLRYTKDLKVTVRPIAPIIEEIISDTERIPVPYEAAMWVNATSSYFKTDVARIYVGQDLYFTAQTSAERQPFTDCSFTAEYTSDNPSAKYTSEPCEHNGFPAIKFNSQNTGRYTVVLTSTLNPKAVATLTIEVSARMSEAELLSGTHTAAVSYPRRGTTVTAVFESLGGTDIINITFRHTESNTVFNERLTYEYDSATRTLTTKHSSGGEGFAGGNVYQLGCKLTINEDYDFVLTYNTGFGDITETVVLARQAETSD